MGMVRSGHADDLRVCRHCRRANERQPNRHDNRAKGSSSPASLAFRSSVDTPPAGWKGPVFKLSRDYPKTPPKCDAPWLKRQVNFNSPDPQWKDWEGYIQDIIDYVKAGQDPNLAKEWNIDVGGQTRWYHVPWMAFDGQARTRVRARVDERTVDRSSRRSCRARDGRAASTTCRATRR